MINASLLEVFLALTFIIFALAVFEKEKATEAEQKLVGTISSQELNLLRDSLERALLAATAQSDTLQRAQAVIDSLFSRYPGDCDRGQTPDEVLAVTFTRGGPLRVEVLRPFLEFDAGDQMDLSPAEFRSRFASVARYSKAHVCRYKVRIRDNPEVSKIRFKEAMGAVESVFRYRGAF